MANLRRKFKGKLQQKQNVPYTIAGVLGSDTGIIKVPNRNNYVYVRLAGSGTAEVFNNRVQAIYDLPVICGYDPLDPQKFQVLSLQGQVIDMVGSTINLATGYAPASRYRWMYPGGGQDPLFVEGRQIMPLRITPIAGMKFIVHNQVIFNGTNWEIFGGSTETDLSSYVPTTAGKCRMVLISIDENGDIKISEGSEVDIADLLPSNIPSPPEGTRFVLGAIRLYYGQTLIQEARNNTDIVDLRFAQIEPSTNSVVFPPDPYTEIVTTDGFATLQFNYGLISSISSMTLGETDYQVLTFIDKNSHVVIGVKSLPSGDWNLYCYDGTNNFPEISIDTTDGHRNSQIGLDKNGYIHIAYGHHIDPLVYRMSTSPVSSFAGELTDTLIMKGTHETQVTYPTFFNDPSGELYFLFRDGGAGAGDTYFYKYNLSTSAWNYGAGTGTQGLLVSGIPDDHSVYMDWPSFDEDFGSGGYMHLCFTWKDRSYTPTGNKNMCYVRWDGTTFSKTSGAQTIPITVSNCEVIDSQDSTHEFDFGRSASDSNGHPHIVYTKLDSYSARQVYHTWHNGTSWIITQITNSEFAGMWCLIVVDHTDDTVYILYKDSYAHEGILLAKSESGDYTNWSLNVLYPLPVASFEGMRNGVLMDFSSGTQLSLDANSWYRDKTLYIWISNWVTGEDSLPIRIMTWKPEVNWYYPLSVYHTHTHIEITDFDDGVQSNRLDQMATPTSPVNFGGQKITNLGTPTLSSDAATKNYVDNNMSVGQYRQFLYILDGLGDFQFLTDDEGHPLTGLLDLEE